MQSIRAVTLVGLSIFALAAIPSPVSQGQGPGAPVSSSIAEWETLRPEGEQFEILMPKPSKAEVSKDPYHKMTITTRLYLSDHPSGSVFAVSSMSGIKTNPSLYSQAERVNSYVDAFKRWFPVRLRGKDAVGKVSLVGTKVLSGHTGRNYNFVVGDLSGTMEVFATRKRFYAVVYLAKKKDAATKQQFLSSFVLPEKENDPPPTVAAEKQPEAAEPAVANPESPKREVRAATAEGSPDTPAEPKPGEVKPNDPVNPNNQGRRNPISGGVLNAKALSLPPPQYPAEARAARAVGTVTVQVTIDEYGNVQTARPVSGHPLLQPPAVAAAFQAKFSPTFLMGEAVKVTGVLVYNFVQ